MPACMNPEEIHRQFIICLLKKDLDGALALYHPAALFVPGPNQDAVSGEAIAAEIQKFMLVAPNMDLVDRSVYLADDICFVAMRWRMKNSDDGVVYSAMDTIKRNPDGSWQFLIDNPYGV